jgi:hypothetical protein
MRILSTIFFVALFSGGLSAQILPPPTTLPLGVAGTFYSFQIQTGGTILTNWFVVSGNLPPGLTLTSAGLLVGTPAAAGVYPFTAQAATVSTTPQTVTQAFTITINRALNIVTPVVLPPAILGSPYSVSLQISGGVPPYTWTNLGGLLPAGISLSSDGILKGTPTGLGSFTLNLQASDSFTPSNQVSRNFSLAVTNPLAITTLSLPNGIQNMAYKQQLQSAGGLAPYTWLVTSGTVPAGLTLTTDGVLQGTPTVTGAQSLTVTLTDSLEMTVSRTFSLTIDPPISAPTVPSLPGLLQPRDVIGVQLSLSQPHPSPLSGQLSLSFTSSAEVPVDDPMTQFSTGSRVAHFTIPANSTAAVFDSAIKLLTGTVAGTVSLSVSFDSGPSNILAASATIAASGPQITNVAAVRTSSGLNLQITGYSPSRRVTSAEFDFTVKSGSTTQLVILQSNVDPAFSA